MKKPKPIASSLWRNPPSSSSRALVGERREQRAGHERAEDRVELELLAQHQEREEGQDRDADADLRAGVLELGDGVVEPVPPVRRVRPPTR